MLVGFSVDYTVHLCDSYIHNGVVSSSSPTGAESVVLSLADSTQMTSTVHTTADDDGVEIGMVALARDSPGHITESPPPYSPQTPRACKTSVSPLDRFTNAMNHVGTPIFHSAVTTGVASLVLCFCATRLMVQVGLVIAINAAIGLITTFVILGALLVTFGPDDFSFLKTTTAWTLRLLALAATTVGMVIFLAG